MVYAIKYKLLLLVIAAALLYTLISIPGFEDNFKQDTETRYDLEVHKREQARRKFFADDCPHKPSDACIALKAQFQDITNQQLRDKAIRDVRSESNEFNSNVKRLIALGLVVVLVHVALATYVLHNRAVQQQEGKTHLNEIIKIQQKQQHQHQQSQHCN